SWSNCRWGHRGPNSVKPRAIPSDRLGRPVMLSLFSEGAGTWSRWKCLPDWKSSGCYKPLRDSLGVAVAWVNEVEGWMWFRAPLNLALLLLSARLAFADACILTSAPRFQMKSDTVEWTMRIVNGRSCIRGLSYGGVSVDTVKLVSPPQFGQVRVFGSG